jgi:TRAP-type C4-dicarboxylate transport system permease small subunit
LSSAGKALTPPKYRIIIINDDHIRSFHRKVSMSRLGSTHALSSGLGRFVDRMNAAIRLSIAGLLAAMCACALLQVLVRLALDFFKLDFSVPWSEELARYAMIWLIFLGAAHACRRSQLISLTIVVERVPPQVRQVASVLAALVCIAFYAMLIKVGFTAIRAGAVEMSPVLQFPKAYVYAAMPIGAAAMILNTLAMLAESFGWIADTGAEVKPAGAELGSAQ